MKNNFLIYFGFILYLNISSLSSVAEVTYNVLSGTENSLTNHAEASGDNASVQAEVGLSMTLTKSLALANSDDKLENSPGGLFGESTQIPASTLVTSKRVDELKDNQTYFTINGALASTVQNVLLTFPSSTTLLSGQSGQFGSIVIDLSGSLVGSGITVVGGNQGNQTNLETAGVKRFRLEGKIDPSTITTNDRAGTYVGNVIITATLL
jgi:hypothetical protein